MRLSFFFLLLFSFGGFNANAVDKRDNVSVVFYGSDQNDLYLVLKNQNIKLNRVYTIKDALKRGKKGDVLIFAADSYPTGKFKLDEEFYQTVRSKGFKVYVEYPSYISGVATKDSVLNMELERGVVASDKMGSNLKRLTILGINDSYVVQTKVDNPLLIIAKVAGLNKAEYGIDDVVQHPLLFKKDGIMIATSKLTNFATGRYGPNDAWKSVWEYIIRDLSGNEKFTFSSWLSYVTPMYGKNDVLPATAKAEAIRRGVDWFENARLYIHPTWEKMYLDYQGKGEAPFGPAVSQSLPNGDGKLGLLEGHASKIYHNGTQQYRYWSRADVQGEAGLALAAAGNYLSTEKYNERAKNLIDYVFYNSNLRAEERNDKNSPSYGLIGWSVTHPCIYYGDDNARALLGMIGASAFMKTEEWDEKIVEGIIANFRTTGKYGFRGERQEDKELQEKGWKHFWERDIEHYAPHFESWTWATYLWLYDKTGYKPLLEKTRNGIKMMMAGYPDKWVWTNGIQQERARMILVLSWLVRIEDTAEHRGWLDKIVGTILDNQDKSGGILEWLGAGDKGRFGKTTSNAEYGKHEAPLIFTNGDPIADMLYTTNFAYFGLNEAYHATGNQRYKKALDKMSEFLIRIQVKSDKYKDLDGAWFRGFEFDKWEYWASNADAGWGAWGTLSGWTQSWIVATEVLTGQNQSFWNLTKTSKVNNHMPKVLDLMVNDVNKKK